MKKLINKTFLVCLQLLISLQLILIPLQEAKAASCNYPASETLMIQDMNSCNEAPGKDWNCTVNRCFFTEEAVGFQAEYADCLALESEAARKSCQDVLASDYVDSQGIDQVKGTDSSLETLSSVLTVLQVFHIIMAFSVGKATASCTPMKMYMGAAAMGLFNEVSNLMFVTDKTKELKKEYQKIEAQPDGYDQQILSFDYLATFHDVAAKTAGKKKSGYMMAGAMHSAVTVMALIEALWPPDACVVNGDAMKDGDAVEDKTPTPKTPGDTGFLYDFEFEKKYSYLMENSKTDAAALANFMEWAKLDKNKRQQSLSLTQYEKLKEWEGIELPEQKLSLGQALAGAVEQLIIAKAYAQNQPQQQNGQAQLAQAANSKKEDNGGGIAGAIGGQIAGPLMSSLLGSFGGGGGASPEAVNALSDSQKSFKSNWLRSSYTIAAISGVSATVAFLLFSHFREVEKRAKRNAREIRAIKAKFMTVVTGGCDRDVNNPNKPSCYCYDVKGAAHPTRQSEMMCQEFYKSFKSNAASEFNYLANPNFTPYGCMNKARMFDKECDCKKTNSCFSIPATDFGSVGQNLSAVSLSRLASSQLQGNTQAANLSASSLTQSALANKDLMEKTLAKANKSFASKGITPISLSADAIKRITASVATPNTIARLGLGGVNKASGIPSYRPRGIRRLQRQLRKSKVRYGSSKGLNKKSARGGSSGFAFKFPSRSKKSGFNKSGKVQRFKGYKVGGADINKRTDVPIWKTITNRYRKSAYPKLLE